MYVGAVLYIHAPVLHWLVLSVLFGEFLLEFLPLGRKEESK